MKFSIIHRIDKILLKYFHIFVHFIKCNQNILQLKQNFMKFSQLRWFYKIQTKYHVIRILCCKNIKTCSHIHQSLKLEIIYHVSQRLFQQNTMIFSHFHQLLKI